MPKMIQNDVINVRAARNNAHNRNMWNNKLSTLQKTQLHLVKQLGQTQQIYKNAYGNYFGTLN